LIHDTYIEVYRVTNLKKELSKQEEFEGDIEKLKNIPVSEL